MNNMKELKNIINYIAEEAIRLSEEGKDIDATFELGRLSGYIEAINSKDMKELYISTRQQSERLLEEAKRRRWEEEDIF